MMMRVKGIVCCLGIRKLPRLYKFICIYVVTFAAHAERKVNGYFAFLCQLYPLKRCVTKRDKYFIQIPSCSFIFSVCLNENKNYRNTRYILAIQNQLYYLKDSIFSSIGNLSRREGCKCRCYVSIYNLYAFLINS